MRVGPSRCCEATPAGSYPHHPLGQPVGGAPIVTHAGPNSTSADGRGPSDRFLALTPDSAPLVRLAWASRFDARGLADHARRNPGLGLLTNDGRQYVIAGLWRKRPEIAELIEATSGNQRVALLEELAERLADGGKQLIVLDYGLEARDPAFYRQAGFQLVERILEYERPHQPIHRALPRQGALRLYEPADRPAVLAVERESFPWLWWNSPEEWDSYIATPGVEVAVATLDEEIVGYAGWVVYHRDGHLDRLAVRQTEQGHGFGAALLTAALARMEERGARRVALTTQETNVRSQRLYEQNGFRRARWTYDIHGRWLSRPSS